MELNLSGVVTNYDSATGIGSIEADRSVSLQFQCTQLLDGSREVEAGQLVCFDIIAAGPGLWEAGAILKLG